MKEMAIKPQHIKDNQGKELGVFLTTSDFKYLLEELEELEDIKSYDKAKKRGGEEIIPFKQVIEELRNGVIK